ncbi:MAG: ribosomal protein S18-alanine N-acetyltransferase [Anaerolineae bacterium]|nr:ribosomal protein S18-alanine N-acetyltransferase [Anaerolineae bacterium]
MALTLRYMRLADIPQVVAIDQITFVPPWSARSYAYEIAESTYSHMVVLEETEEQSTSKSFLRWLFAPPRGPLSRIVGYGGLWLISDEAHISTIATHPEFRRRGWGELLLAGMVKKALLLKASYVVLEVRISNVTAQNLYHKYGFNTVDVKKGYYHNNGEDAYDMRLDLGDKAVTNHLDGLFAQLLSRNSYQDVFTNADRTPQRPQR